MLANVAHSPAWRSSQGYVCLACRVSNRRPQRRRFQTEATTAAADSWFEGLNDINVDFGGDVTKRQAKKYAETRSKREVKATEKEKEKEKGRSKNAFIAKEMEKVRSNAVTVDDLLLALGGPSREKKGEGDGPNIIKHSRKEDLVIRRYHARIPAEPVTTGLEDTSFHQDRRKSMDGAITEESAQASTVAAEVKQESGGQETKKKDTVDEKMRLIALLKRDVAKSAKQEEKAAQEDNVTRETIHASDNSHGVPLAPASNDGFASRYTFVNGVMVRSGATVLPAEIQQAPAALPVVQETPDDVLDKPMRLVDRYLQNKKRTLPWGIPAGVHPRVLMRAYAPSAKIAAKPKINSISKASNKSSVTTPNHEVPIPVQMEMLRAELSKKTGAEQTVTEDDVADELENATDHTDVVEDGSNLSAAGTVVAEISSLPVEEMIEQQPEPIETPEPSMQSVEAAIHSSSEATSRPTQEEVKRLLEPIEPLEPSMQSEEAATHSSSEATISTQDQAEEPDPASVRLTAMYERRTPAPASAQMRLGGLYEEGGPLQSPLKSPTPALAEPGETSVVRTYTSLQNNGIVSRSQAQTRFFHLTTSRGTARHANTVADRAALPATKSIGAAMRAPFRTSSKGHVDAKPVEKSADTASQEEETTPVAESMGSIEPASINIEPVDIPQPPVPFLEYGLDRVLFNPGVYQLQDPASRVYNFDPYLQKVMPVAEFDFDSLKEYKTSSQDHALAELAKAMNKKYIGSTSSMTSSLAHFHYLLSNWRSLNLSMLTDGFVTKNTNNNFTEINRAPSAIFLRWKDGTYAIDADKEFDGANVLMLLGKSMELLLTLPKSEYERYRKSDPRKIPEAERTAPESYQYTTMRDFLMRSQLDAYDPRLPGRGTFDLKTRAVVSVRMQAQDFEPMTGYEIFGLHGKWGSYEREYFDMMRSTMLKYMLQARMGQMNGIFVAYHNVKRIFGFQYIPMHDLDRALHGQTDPCLGDQEFKASLEIMNEVFNRATAKFPGQSLRFHFETRKDPEENALHVFAEPMSEEDIDRIQDSQKAKIQEFERSIMGKTDAGEVKQPATTPSKEPAMTTESSTSLSTNSDADTSFLSSISSHKPEENLKPLFYATVKIHSKVNDDTPQGDRPSNLKREDKWEILYVIEEPDITPHEWALYEDCRVRRKFALTERDDEDGGDPESEGKPKQTSSFIKLLKDMATEGKAFRDKMDVMEAGKENVRVDVPLPKQREKIEDVEDYMRWMYSKSN